MRAIWLFLHIGDPVPRCPYKSPTILGFMLAPAMLETPKKELCRILLKVLPGCMKRSLVPFRLGARETS